MQSIPRASASVDRLRLQLLGGEDAPALGARRVEADPLEVARELLDGVDRPDALDLDRDPAVVRVTAHQVDRANVRGPLALHEPQAVGERLGLRGELLLEVPLDAVLLERCGLAHVVRDVAQHLVQPDLEPVLRLARPLADDDALAVLLDHGRRRHPVQGLVAPGVCVDEHAAVRLEHQQAASTRAGRR